MPDLSSQAVLLRRIDYGDNDLIVTLFTPDSGKLTVIAKSAKKSKKRFPGILEIFSHLTVVYSENQRGNLPILKEAVLQDAFINIRADIRKTAYAAYWVELINLWLQDGKPQKTLYHLLLFVLSVLDSGAASARVLSIYYQIKFLSLVGLTPHLDTCCLCRTQSDCLMENRLTISLQDGGLVCRQCRPQDISFKTFTLAKGTLKQLVWIAQRDWPAAARARFSEAALKEALDFLEAFVPYHVGRVPKSLTFIKKMETMKGCARK